MMSIQQRIQQRRKDLGFSQTELAKIAGLNPSAISQYEAGNRNPSYDALIKLSGALQVNTEYLLIGESSSTYNTNDVSNKEKTLHHLFKKLRHDQQDTIIQNCYNLLGISKPKFPFIGTPSEYADYIIRQQNTNEFPINIDKIAGNNNIKIHYVDLIEEDDAEGILYNGTNKIILLQKSLAKVERIRFSLAKLIGHAILPTHVNPEYIRTRSSTLQTNRNEDMEAQIFAEYLLIPESEFSKDLLEFQQNKERHETIKYLTSKYIVSETMLVHTLVNRHANRFAVIFSTPRGIIDKTLSKGKTLIQKGDPIPTLSKAAQLVNKVEKVYISGVVPAHLWVKDAAPYDLVSEYTSFDPKYGYLTLIEFI